MVRKIVNATYRIVADRGLARAERMRASTLPSLFARPRRSWRSFPIRGRGRPAGRRRSPNRVELDVVDGAAEISSRPARLSVGPEYDGCRSRQYPPRRVLLRVDGEPCWWWATRLWSFYWGNQALSGDELCRPRRRCRHEFRQPDGGISVDEGGTWTTSKPSAWLTQFTDTNSSERPGPTSFDARMRRQPESPRRRPEALLILR